MFDDMQMSRDGQILPVSLIFLLYESCLWTTGKHPGAGHLFYVIEKCTHRRG